MKFIDIGANLTDPVFKGLYRGKRKHPDDFSAVLQRAEQAGVEKIIVTSGCLADFESAQPLLAQHPDRLYTTIGCHPTRCNDFERIDSYLEKLREISASSNKQLVAYGEFGLDFDRLQFCPRDTQLKYFEQQLRGIEHRRPLFLHCRLKKQQQNWNQM